MDNGIRETKADPGRPGTARAAGDRREQKAEAAKSAICEAVIECLDAVGYAETSITRIIETAGISRGALTHYFPTKEDLIVATSDRLLRRAAGTRLLNENKGPAPAAGGDFTADLLKLWDRMVNTREGRAFLEILVAARTDKALQVKIRGRLRYWNGAMNDHFAGLYKSADGDEDRVRLIWTICRVFLRGLITQDRFSDAIGNQRKLVACFAEMIAPHLERKTATEESAPYAAQRPHAGPDRQ